MTTRKRFYVGYILPANNREVFSSATVPTEESHGHVYAASVGPFRTRAGADYMASYRGPVAITVSEAERRAKEKLGP